MADQTVDAYLVDSGAIQEGCKRVPAVMRGMVGGDPNRFQGGFEALCISLSGDRLSVNGEQNTVVDCKPVLYKTVNLGVNGDNPIFSGGSL